MTGESIGLSRYLARIRRGESAGEPGLADLVLQMAFASKAVAREIRRAALVGRLGLTGERNPSGDAQKELDVYANEAVLDAFRDTDLVAGIVSEELERLRTVACDEGSAHILCVDPLDGSSNTDVNGALGTIFGFYRRVGTGRCDALEEELRDGAELVAGGYVFYGPSTLLIFSIGGAPVGFTLDQGLGEYLVSHDEIRCPETGSYYSANLGNFHDWDRGVRSFAEHIRAHDPGTGRPYSLRYSGALVADLHRCLMQGGIYFYPGGFDDPEGKLRLLYECAPLAFVTERAGGLASTGRGSVLAVRPDSLHQAVPFAAGSRREVELYQRYQSTGHSSAENGNEDHE